jgi:hypothetical protein
MSEIVRQRQVTVSSVLVASSGQVSVDINSEAIILNLQDGRYYGLDPVGALIWERIQTPARVSDVVADLLNEFEVEPEQCRDDVLSLLNELAGRGLVEFQDGEPVG